MPLPWANAFPIPGTRLVSEFRGDFNSILDATIGSFTGPEEPPQVFPGMYWVDTSEDPRLLKQRKSDGTGWVVRAEVDSDYGGVLALDGGTMRGAINMDGFGISNLPAGSGNAPARYADLAPYAKLDGSVAFTGIPTLPNLDPSASNHAARKAYVDTKVAAGGTYVGQILMQVAPTDLDHVMRKGDVDNRISSHTHDGSSPQGVKVQGVNIASSGAAAGQILEANGGSAAAWVTRVALSQRDQPSAIVIDSKADTYFGSSSVGTWKTVDLSGVIAAGSKGALLQILFGDASSGAVSKVKAYVRKTGLSLAPSQAIQIDCPCTVIDDQSYDGLNDKRHIFAMLDAFRRFDIAVIPNSGNLTNFNLSLWCIGEF